MRGWEYKIVALQTYGYGADTANDHILNHMGAEGWELVAIDAQRHHAYFKRYFHGPSS